MGNLRQTALQKALDLDVPDWRSKPDGEIAAWLKSRKIKNGRGLWLDSRAVAELKRTLAKAAATREAKVGQRFTEYVEEVQVRLRVLITELDGNVSAKRLKQLEAELFWLTCTVSFEDHFAQFPVLHRALAIAERKFARYEAGPVSS